MPLHKIPYTPQHFLLIRDFLVETYDPDALHHNWHIDRWNFCRHVSQTIHETADSWPGTVGIWVDEAGAIQAVVNSEGENRGEAFLQLAPIQFPAAALNEFIDHAEEHLALAAENSQKAVSLHIGPRFRQLAEILAGRGYQPAGMEEAGILEIKGAREVELPQGFSLVDGPGFSDEARGLAHSLAFGYASEETDMVQKYHIVEAFARMRQAPDYRPDLDLAAVNQAGEVAAFACLWFDAKNRIGILEPLGTVPAYQKLGLASALLNEGINRLQALGATRLFGGAGQAFYLKYGFEIVDYRQVWSKKWSQGGGA